MSVDVAMRHSLGAASLQASLDVSNLREVVALETLAHVICVIIQCLIFVFI
jgi:hypothetical protein